MAISVRQLVRIPDLMMQTFAGASGLDREITWAHVSELPDPTEWLDAGELLMTTGLGMPKEPAAQRAYVERLADAGLSGLVLSHRMHAPELSMEMVSVADKRSFPVLFVAYEVPFTAVARAVADANVGEEREHLARTQRIYDTVRLAAGNVSGSELMMRLGDIVDCCLYVLDPDCGFHPLPGTSEAPGEIVAALKEEASKRTRPIPALLRLGTDPGSAIALAVPASRRAALVVLPRSEKKPDLPVLRHITAVAALEIERRKADHEYKRRLGAELLAGLIDSRISPESAAQLLPEWGIAEEPRVLAACIVDAEDGEPSDLHLRLQDRGIPHLLLRRPPFLMSLLPDAPEALDGFREEIDFAFAIGLSDPLGRVTRAPDAQREALWALEGAQASGKSLVRYGEDAALSPFLPSNLSEAERIVRYFIGPLLDYDTAQDAHLLESLKVFLSHNRSWQKAAAALHVHKQTLIYRMRRVEEISGKKLNRTEDIAELWLALKAAEALGLLGPHPRTVPKRK